MKNKRSDFIGGILLISFGLLALVTQFVNLSETMGLLILPLIAVAFLAAGIVTRHPGFIIPGGIIGGIGAGAFLIAGPFKSVSGDDQGAIFLLSFAAGWALITVLTAVFSKETHWWPLIPGGIMALIGGSILLGGVFNQTLTLLGKIWPLFLILGGAYILFNSRQHNQEKLP